jgi:hypothetical protein
VIETSILPHAGFKRALARVAERRVSQIVGEGNSLGQIVVEAEAARQGPGDLRHFDRMGEPSAEVIAVERDENLRLMGEPSKGGRMENAVAVALKLSPRRRNRLGEEATAGLGGVAGVGRTK